jgi:thioredoxin:protein disulfide reductase
MRHTRATLLLSLSCVLIAGCAKTGSNVNEPPRIASVDVVEAHPQETTIARGESRDVVMPITIATGYHVNANPPSYSYLKATELEIATANGITVEFITYPDPLIKKFSFAEQPLAVYEGEAIVKARLKADSSAQTGKHNLSAKLRVQACDDKVCYAPGVLDVMVPVDIK